MKTIVLKTIVLKTIVLKTIVLKTIVLKLGGSLLDLPDLQLRMEQLIARDYPRCCVLVVVGGGLIVDAVRQYHSVHYLGQQDSHWLCVELMNSTASLFQLVSGWRLIKDADALTEWLCTAAAKTGELPENLVSIVAPSAFYSQALNATALPTSWQSTSDSIAALLARITRAQEIVMLKSTDQASATEEPLLDEVFERVVPQGLAVRVVNLRA